MNNEDLYFETYRSVNELSAVNRKLRGHVDALLLHLSREIDRLRKELDCRISLTERGFEVTPDHGITLAVSEGFVLSEGTLYGILQVGSLHDPAPLFCYRYNAAGEFFADPAGETPLIDLKEPRFAAMALVADIIARSFEAAGSKPHSARFS